MLEDLFEHDIAWIESEILLLRDQRLPDDNGQLLPLPTVETSPEIREKQGEKMEGKRKK